MRGLCSEKSLPTRGRTRATLSRLLAAICVSTLIQGLVLLSPAIAKEIVLGVARNQDNAAEWAGITQRLQTAKVAYRVVDLQQFRTASDLSGLTVLFLPNIENLTAEQTIALEEWMSQGGRLIVSGPVGRLSPLGVRQALRSLLGAYWAFPLSQPSTLQTITTQPQAWTRKAAGASTIWGGAIIPSSLNSQTVAVWKGTANGRPSTSSSPTDSPPAVVTTERTTFLGWNWGKKSSGSVEFDSAWLRAALGRYGEIPTGTAQAPTPSQTATSPQTQATRPTQTPTPTVRSLRLPDAVPPSSLAPALPPTGDPAEQVAPAGLEVEQGALPITQVEANAMRQELENLIGRFESALLSANAFDTSIAATTPPATSPSATSSETSSSLVASTKEVVSGERASGPALASAEAKSAMRPESAVQAIAQARQRLQTFSELVGRKDYANARQQWLQARQILWDNYPSDRFRAQPEIRAIWLDRGTIVRAGSEQKLAAIFDRLAAAGINTIFFETVNAGYPIYPSRVAPQQNPLTRNWDPLAAAVKLAHQRNMELHAWVWAFAAGNERHNTLLGLPKDYPGPLIAAHPDWANYDNRGQKVPVGQGKPFLDPANPEVRRYMLALLEEIATRYAVDGVQLDYIRYPFQDPSAGRTYGYGRAARQQFQQLTGVDPMKISPSDRERWQQWTDFRTQQINSFVADVSSHLRKIRSNIVLSVAVFPLSEHERIHKLQQHWEVWAREGNVDLIVPMAYALDTNRFQRLVQPYLTQTHLGSALILPGIRLLDLPEAIALDQIQALRDLPSDGYALFAAENFNDRFLQIFSRTQGTAQRPEKDPIPYRKPFAAAAVRYAGLQQEWNFLRSNDNLRMREPALSDWQAQAKALEISLNQLAENPSRDRLAVAQRNLRIFRAKFRQWMSLHAIENRYQVSTWEYRLATLESLLSYGERVALNNKN